MSDQTILAQVDPSTLLVDTNIRASLALDKAFCASIKTHGVIVPIVAVRTADGVRVRAGHRRVAAALAAGLPTVPVVIADEDTPEDVRIVEQMAENDHRTAISTAERIDAVHQLSLLGVSAAQIAKRTHRPRTEVDAALAVASSEVAVQAAEAYSLTVASWVAEFEHDPATVEAILGWVERWGEDRARHEVERVRQQIVDQQARHEAAALVEDVRVIDEPGWDAKHIAPVVDLRDVDGQPIDATAHATCPGHCITINEAWVPGEDDEDEAADPVDLTAAGRDWTFTAYCEDWERHGHHHRYRTSRNPALAAADLAAVDGQLVEVRKEAERAERRRVIAANKAWDAAATVRREWLAGLLSRKTPPADAVLFVLRALLARPDLSSGRAAVAAHLGVESTYGDLAVPDLTAAKATMATLTLILTSMEEGTTRDDWRRTRTATALYLGQLEAWGYTLSDVEVAATGRSPFTLPQ